MIYRPLGRSGLRLGLIGLGAEHLENAPRETVTAVVHTALDHGVNYIDLFMGSPGVRDNFGHALAGRREEVLIAGHLGATWDGQYVKSRESKICEEFVHDLLRRLRIDSLGVLMLHYVDDPADCDRIMAAEGLLETALRLKEQGKARCLGVSSHAVPTARRLVESGYIDALMFPVNPLFDRLPGAIDIDAHWQEEPYREALAASGPRRERNELYQACLKADVGIVAMKPYAAGWLLKPENPIGFALTPVQCLGYALARPGVAAAVPGCRNAEEMLAALAYLDASDGERDFSAVYSSPLLRTVAGCMYCNHCLPCPAGMDIAAIMRLLDAAEGGAAESARAKYAALPVKASSCTGCCACAERCPFGIDPPARMRKAVAIFEK